MADVDRSIAGDKRSKHFWYVLDRTTNIRPRAWTTTWPPPKRSTYWTTSRAWPRCKRYDNSCSVRCAGQRR